MPLLRMVLHYYPGNSPVLRIPGTHATAGPGLLLVFQGQSPRFRGEAWGGLSKATPDPDGGPPYTPTPAGTYVLLDPAPYSTRSWMFSEIKWGTRIKPNPKDPTDVLYQLPSK